MLKQIIQITLPYSRRQHLHRAMDVQINNSMIILWHRKAGDRERERGGRERERAREGGERGREGERPGRKRGGREWQGGRERDTERGR